MPKPRFLSIRFILLLFLSLAASGKERKFIAGEENQKKLNSYSSKCKETCLEDSVKVRLLLQVADDVSKTDPKSAFNYCTQAYNLSKKIKWKEGLTIVWVERGNICLNYHDYHSASKFFDIAIKEWLKLIKSKKYPPVALTLYYNDQLTNTLKLSGISYYYFGNTITALEKLNQALDLSLQNHLDKHNPEIYFYIGNILQSEGKTELAIENYKKSLKQTNYLIPTPLIISINTSLGDCYYVSKNNKDALSCYLKADKLLSKNDPKKPDIKTKIAQVQLSLNKYNSASKNFIKANKKYGEKGNEQAKAANLLRLSELNKAQLKTKESEYYKNESNAIIYEIDSLNKIKSLLRNSAAYYAHKKDYEKALLNQISLNEVNDKLEGKIKQQLAFTQSQSVKLLNAERENSRIESQRQFDRQKIIIRSITIGAFLLLLFTAISFFIYKRKRDSEERLKEQVLETEMKALRSQMNPHFIFNALQSIQTFLLKNKSEEAGHYLLKFSKLMRLVLENSQQQEVSIKKDFKALELYMQLESIRLPYPFTYEFQIESGIDEEETTIPPLILQPIVENAIWHGLQYKEGPGHISINISRHNDSIHAVVEDNGVGRESSSQVKHPLLLKKESLGMKLTEERIKIFNELKKIKSHFYITDLFTHENEPAGTKVELTLPFSL